MTRATETDDVDGSCFVSKSPAACSASRVPPHVFSSSTCLFFLERGYSHRSKWMAHRYL